MFLTLPANQAKVDAKREKLAKIDGTPISERAAARGKYMSETAAAEGDSNFARLSAAENQFIDLAIHKDTFLDDVAIMTDVDAEVPLYWKSRYEPVVGMTAGSVFGPGMAHIYQTQDNYATLTPFVVDVEEVRVPALALTQDVNKLGQREAGLRRQAEALRLAMEQYLMNVLLGQSLGTDLATSVTNYVSGGAPYTGKTVYIADPGVQSGTYETSNIIDIHLEAGLTPAVFEAIRDQEILSKRLVRTIHLPVVGLPWRKLFRYATIVANSVTGAAGEQSNKNLEAIPATKWQEIWDSAMGMGESFTVSLFGRTYKFKTNNALPQGYAICTTDLPGAEVFNIMSESQSLDYAPDPRDNKWVSHYEKRQLAIAQPDPWLRNFFVLYFGNTSL